MVSRRTDRLLHKITHHTNLEQPYDINISGIKYPAQDADLLGRTVTLRYKNRYIPDETLINNDSSYEPSSSIVDGEGNIIRDIYEDEFIVLRCDLTAPYKALFLSTNYKIMLVGDSRTYQDTVLKYPKQIEEFIGLYMRNQYYETPDIELKSVLLSCDSTEPGNGIIAEFYMNNTVRFLLDYEVQSVVLDRYDADGERDFNALDPQDHGLVFIDLDGKFPINEGQPITVDADGGHPDPLADMYRKDILTLEEVCELRARILRERQIYGSHGITPREVIVSPKKANLLQGETLQLEAEVKYDPTTPYTDVVWRSSDESLATVDETGLVTSIGSGKVQIYAIATDVWGKCSVNAIISVTGVELDQNTLTMEINDEVQLNATVSPMDATNKKVIWSSSDNSIVKINKNGKIVAKSKGSAIITVTTEDGNFTSTCSVDVVKEYIPVESIRITNVPGGIINLSTNGTEPNEFVLDVQVLPVNATDKNVFGRVHNKYDDFAVYVENITENSIRIKGLCYSCNHPNVVEVYSRDNTELFDTVEVIVDTKLESINVSSNNIQLDPEFIEGSIDKEADWIIDFYPQNKGILPDIFTVGPNDTDIMSTMDTLYNTNSNVIEIEDLETYKDNRNISNTVLIKSKQPGTAKVGVTDIVSGEIKECTVTVGELEINSIQLSNIPKKWSDIHPGDEFIVDLIVDPYYWYNYPDLYSITWTIEGNESGAIEVIDNITSITVMVRDICSNITLTATSNNNKTARFIIPEITEPEEDN